MSTLSKSSQRALLRTELMSFSKVCNRINEIETYLLNYSKGQKEKGKHQNGVNTEYAFLNFATKHVYVFGGLLLDKKAFSDDTMFNLLCAIADLPLNDFDQKVRSGKEWVTIKAFGFSSLVKKFDDFIDTSMVKVEEQKTITREVKEKVTPKAKKGAKVTV